MTTKQAFTSASFRERKPSNTTKKQRTMLKTEFVGHIGADAEIKDFNGKRFISFNVAASERFKDAQGQTVTRTTWVSCLKPGDGAVVNYLKKGTQVFCRGNLTAKPYTGKNGVEAGLNCTVTELELLGSRQDAQQNQQAQPEAATPPQSCPAPGETYPGGYSGGYGSNQYPGGFPTQNEDRPF